MPGATPIICPRCGSQSSITENFCGNCGYQFRGTQEMHPAVPFSNSPQTRTKQTGLSDTLPAFFPQPPPQPRSNTLRTIVFAILALLIIVVLFVTVQLEILSGHNSRPGITGNTPNTSHQSGTVPSNGNSTITVTIPAPSPTATPTLTPTSMPTDTPTPLPYSVSKTGDVCKPPYSQFQATGWVPEKDSFVFTGNGSNVVISPCNISTPSYSVQATITLLISNSSPPGVGVIAHADSGGQTGYAGGAGCRNISFGRCGFFINDQFGDIMGIDQENENLTGQTHTYKLVIDGITLKLFYDNSTIPIVTKSLATYPQAGYAGFECYDQCQVTGYTVTGI